MPWKLTYFETFEMKWQEDREEGESRMKSQTAMTVPGPTSRLSWNRWHIVSKLTTSRQSTWKVSSTTLDPSLALCCGKTSLPKWLMGQTILAHHFRVRVHNGEGNMAAASWSRKLSDCVSTSTQNAERTDKSGQDPSPRSQEYCT